MGFFVDWGIVKFSQLHLTGSSFFLNWLFQNCDIKYRNSHMIVKRLRINLKSKWNYNSFLQRNKYRLYSCSVSFFFPRVYRGQKCHNQKGTGYLTGAVSVWFWTKNSLEYHFSLSKHTVNLQQSVHFCVTVYVTCHDSDHPTESWGYRPTWCCEFW